MIDALLLDLVERKITSVKEISRLTGRGPSTVYRWLNGETQPDIREVLQLIRELTRPEARQELIKLFTVGLPVRVEWLTPQHTLAEGQSLQAPHDVTDLAMLTLECLAKVLLNQRDALRSGEINDKLKLDLSQLLGTSISYLTLAQKSIEEMPSPKRRTARPLPPPPQDRPA